jgi:hypothetical protein
MCILAAEIERLRAESEARFLTIQELLDRIRVARERCLRSDGRPKVQADGYAIWDALR